MHSTREHIPEKAYWTAAKIPTWTSDSGASTSVTYDRDDFIPGTTKKTSFLVSVGSGTTPCTLVGSIRLTDAKTKASMVFNKCL